MKITSLNLSVIYGADVDFSEVIEWICQNPLPMWICQLLYDLSKAKCHYARNVCGITIPSGRL